MNDAVFFKNFSFNEFYYKETQHRDISQGVALHYIGFMKHGRGRIVSEGQTLEINENEMFYIPKGCRYRSCWISADYVQFDSIGFLYFPTAKPNGYMLQKIHQNSSVWQAFAPLSASKAVHAASIGALYSLLGVLESVLKPAPLDRDVDICEKAIRYMQEDPHKTIPHYAALCGVSESLLYQYTKKLTGKTPNRIRQEILCEKAKELLITTNYTVDEICDKLGFSSAAYFRKTFHGIYGKPPTQVRKKGNTI